MINIFGIFFRSLLSFMKTMITMPFPIIPTEAIIVDKITIISTFFLVPLAEFIVSIIGTELFKVILDIVELIKFTLEAAISPTTELNDISTKFLCEAALFLTVGVAINA